MMLSRIAVGSDLPGSKEESAIDMLLGCHQRIRHFSAVARRLAEASGSPEAEIKQAVEALYRYFTVALPLHEADENDSIESRIRRAVPEGEFGGPAAQAMVEQHRSIDEIVERLLPLWRILQGAPGKVAELSQELKQLSAKLEQMFELHLKLEEEAVFPAMQRYLSEAELQEIVREMRARRT